MHFIAAVIALALAAVARSASPPSQIPKPLPTVPGLFSFQNKDCSFVNDDGNFLPYSDLPSCANCGPCLGTSVFQSVISYSPRNATLPFNVYVDQADASPCGNVTGGTALKIPTTNKCFTLPDNSATKGFLGEYEWFFKSP